MASRLSNGQPLSPRSEVSSLNPAQDPQAMAELVSRMKETALMMNQAYYSIQGQVSIVEIFCLYSCGRLTFEQTAAVATMQPSVDNAQQIHYLRKQLIAQDRSFFTFKSLMQ